MSLIEPEKEANKGDTGEVKIFTLGQFLVQRNDVIISKDTARSYRLWELFKYLITNRDKEIYSEVILENLWPEQEYADPRHTLRTLIYRLRQVLDGKSAGTEQSYIKFAHGTYSWNSEQPYWLDVEAFEQLAREGQDLSITNPHEAIQRYLAALSLYKGDYLAELAYSEWVIPIRNYYHRLYLQSVLDLIALLEKSRRYAEVINVCEKAFLIEFFEEDFHLSFLRALLKEGKTRQARNHYEYATSVFYRELGIKPSPALGELRRLMQADDPAAALDLTSIQDSLLDRRALDGAFFCDPEVFRFLYKLEARRVERTGKAVFLAMLTVAAAHPDGTPGQSIKAIMPQLQEQVVAGLRRGDVVTRWNESQILMILPGLNFEQAEMVMERILTPIKSNPQLKGYNLYNDIKPVLGDSIPTR